MTDRPPQRHRWLQFRLRTLLAAVLVLSLPLSWFAVRLETARRQRKAREMVISLGGIPGFDWEVLPVTAQRSEESWLRDWLGYDYFSRVVQADLDGSQISDANMEQLSELTKLRFLELSCTRISDAGIKHLAGLTELQALTLRDTPVTDVGLEHLRGLVNLRYLSLCNTQVTEEGIVMLQEALNLGFRETDSDSITLHKAPPEGAVFSWELDAEEGGAAPHAF